MNPGNSQAALAQLQQSQAQAQDPNTIMANQRQQLGVNAAQDTVTGLRGAINNTTKLLQSVAPSVMGRTGNSLVTSAQAGRIIQNEQAPISQSLENQGQQYNQANENYSKLNDQANQAAQGAYQSQQDKLSYMQNLYNALYQRERDSESDRVAEVQRQEEARRYNEQLAMSKAAAAKSAGGGSSFNLSGGAPSPAASGGGSTPAKATAQYIGNDDLRGRLAYAAKGGDRNAEVALKYVGNDGKFYLDPKTSSPALIQILQNLGATNVFKGATNGAAGSNVGIAGQKLNFGF